MIVSHEGERGEYEMQHATSEPSQSSGRLWNHSPSLRNPHGNCQVGEDGNRTQIGNPNGMRCRSERETIDNNLNSFRAPSGGNRLSDSSILVNPTSGKRRKNQASQIQFPPPLRVNNVNVSRPTQPNVASNFDPSALDIDRDLLVLRQCYFNQNIPKIPQGLIICESNEDLQQKWLAARKAFDKASDRLEKSESSDPDDDDEDYEETPFADVTPIMSSPQRNMLEKFSEATTKCIPLTLGFAQVDQTWNNVRCPCSGILKGWRDRNDIRISDHELPRCENRTFTPASYMQHVNELSKRCNYHFFLQQYLRILYCDNFGNLRQCVGNPNPLSFDRRRIIWSKINNIDEQELFSETQKIFKDFSPFKEQLSNLFKHVKYYNTKFNQDILIDDQNRAGIEITITQGNRAKIDSFTISGSDNLKEKNLLKYI